jgi:hypothetical protein
MGRTAPLPCGRGSEKASVFQSRDREGVVVMFLALMMAVGAEAVIVDRIAVSVGDKIVTESEIDLRIRLSAFQNREKPDFSLAARRRAAQELIDQRLVEREMDLGHYPRLDDTRRKALLDDYQKTGNNADLAAYGLKPQDLAEDLGRQEDLLTFLNLRFRPAVQVTDQDVQKYFAENVPKGTLNEVRAEIQQKLTDERADKELDLWLQDQRKRTKIEYLEKDLESK